MVVLDKNLYSKTGITYTCLVKFPNGNVEGRLFSLINRADEDTEVEVDPEPDLVLVSARILSLKQVHMHYLSVKAGTQLPSSVKTA